MKKSIFLFFAAILCSMSISAAIPSKLYLDASGWGYSDARYAAYFMPQNSFVDMTKATGEVSVFEVAVPASQTKVIFVRMDGSKPANDWANKWNQTGDLTIPNDGKNKFKPSGWDGATTTWSTYTYTPPTFYIAGDFVTPTWSANAAANKMDYADGVFSKSYDNVAASAHQFKITNGTWDNAVGYNSSTCSGTNCTVENGGGNIKFTPLAEGTVTITYTLADGKVHITCPEPPAAEYNITYPTTQTNYTLVAGAAKAQAGAEVSFTATPADGYVLNVTYNGNAITGNNNVYTFMMPAADVTIAITAVAATTLYYVDNSNWGNANAYMWNDSGNNGWPGVAMTSAGTVGENNYAYYSISFAQGAYKSIIFNNGNGSQTGDLTINTAKPYFYDGAWYTWDNLLAKLAAPVVKTYTVVGSSVPLFGEAWATAKAENDMTLVEGTKYELVKSDIALTAGNILYKVAVDHAWAESYPGDNATLNIAEAGKYTVTFMFDSNTKEVNATAELTEAAVVLPTVGVKGAWDGWAATTTLTGDNTSASATVNIATAGIYEFGLDVDGNFLASGATIDKANNSTVVTTNDANIKLTANVLGDYTFTWTYETNTLTVTYPVGEEVEIAKKYYLIGSFNDWALADATYELTLDGGVYKKEVTLADGKNQMKINNGTWDNASTFGYDQLDAKYEGVSRGTGPDENNIIIDIATGKDITVIFDGSKITFEGLTPDETPTKYYIVGSFNEWNTTDPNYELILDGEVYKKEVTFAKDVQFKVCDGTWVNSWGKDNLGGKLYNELAVNGENIQMKEDKTFTIIFDLANNLITFDGLTEKAPAVVTYVLMGVGGWDQPGIELVQNPDPEKASEYMLTCQAIAATDAVKVVKCEDGTAVAWYGSVKDGVQVTVNYDADGNIQLPAGTYNFYFDSSLDDKQLWIESATYTRTATPGSFSTICLPYAGTISGATLFDLSDRDANYVYVVEAGIELEAGKPYVILPTEDKITVTYKNYDYVAAGIFNTLQGTYEEMNADQLNGKYVITGNKYYYVDPAISVGSKLLANRAYFNLNDLPTVPASAPGVRRIALGTNGQNTATGMENVDASAQPVKTIINGQLYILRGEKMYDAQGKLVK